MRTCERVFCLLISSLPSFPPYSFRSFSQVQGSLSTKVEGVVRLMLKIKLSDPEAKVLVFSSWVDVLDVIADAFAQNGITFRALHQHSKFQVW